MLWCLLTPLDEFCPEGGCSVRTGHFITQCSCGVNASTTLHPTWGCQGSTLLLTIPRAAVRCPHGASPLPSSLLSAPVLTQRFPPLHHQVALSACHSLYWRSPAPASPAKNNPVLWRGALAAPIMRRSRSGRRTSSLGSLQHGREIA